MVERVLSCVRSGLRTCFAAYGHPGVFAYPTHEAVRRARAEGYPARMLPGVSAEDCLFADLGVDPAACGCQSYEATDFLLNGRAVDTSAAVILWQVGLVGDPGYNRNGYDIAALPLLVERLCRFYPPAHLAYIYDAAVTPAPSRRSVPYPSPRSTVRGSGRCPRCSSRRPAARRPTRTSRHGPAPSSRRGSGARSPATPTPRTLEENRRSSPMAPTGSRLALVLVGFVVALSPPAPARADGLPFTVAVKDTGWAGPPLQGYAVARVSDGRRLLLCGRTEGLHGQHRKGQPPGLRGNFTGFNDRMYVVDLAARRVDSRQLTDLVPPDVVPSLQVTNPGFVQVGDRLYVAGGFGFTPDSASMLTYARLTVIDVSAAAQAVAAGAPLGGALRQSAPNELFQVAGGELEHIGDRFYLVFGQVFAGFYTPKSNGAYTCEVRSFRVDDPGRGPSSPSIASGSARRQGTRSSDGAT